MSEEALNDQSSAPFAALPATRHPSRQQETALIDCAVVLGTDRVVQRFGAVDTTAVTPSEEAPRAMQVLSDAQPTFWRAIEMLGAGMPVTRSDEVVVATPQLAKKRAPTRPSTKVRPMRRERAAIGFAE